MDILIRIKQLVPMSLYGASKNQQEIRTIVRRWLEGDPRSEDAAELPSIGAQPR